MSFRLFSYDSSFAELVESDDEPLKKLRALQHHMGDKALPEYVIRYVAQTSASAEQIAIHPPTSIANYKDADQDKIERQKGFFGKSQRERFSDAIHHFAIFHNGKGIGRMIYKFEGNIQFIKNLKRLTPLKAA